MVHASRRDVLRAAAASFVLPVLRRCCDSCSGCTLNEKLAGGGMRHLEGPLVSWNGSCPSATSPPPATAATYTVSFQPFDGACTASCAQSQGCSFTPKTTIRATEPVDVTISQTGHPDDVFSMSGPFPQTIERDGFGELLGCNSEIVVVNVHVVHAGSDEPDGNDLTVKLRCSACAQ